MLRQSSAAIAESVCPLILAWANFAALKSNFVPFALLVSAMLSCSPVTNAQDVDKEVAAALKQATEAAAKMGVKMPDVKKQMADIEQGEVREEANKKAALEAQLKAPGPVKLPAWTPKVPQFTPSDLAIKKL